jgi:hypothetical protein
MKFEDDIKAIIPLLEFGTSPTASRMTGNNPTVKRAYT